MSKPKLPLPEPVILYERHGYEPARGGGFARELVNVTFTVPAQFTGQAAAMFLAAMIRNGVSARMLMLVAANRLRYELGADSDIADAAQVLNDRVQEALPERPPGLPEQGAPPFLAETP